MSLMTAYKRLTLYERQKIEESLNARLSFREISRLIDRNASTISREVQTNRYRKDKRAARNSGHCRERSECNAVGICKKCPYPGTLCKTCPDFDCKGRCSSFRKQVTCEKVDRSPWVCNGCSKKSYGCNRPIQMLYSANIADTKSSEIRKSAREGFDMGADKAEDIALYIKRGLTQGLSPYEMSVAYAKTVDVSESTIYRLIEAGVGGCANIELERKVGFKPRSHTHPKSSTSHDKKRSYASFCALDPDRRDSATEMDCIEGRKCDTQAVLTLFFRPVHLQIPLLLCAQDSRHVLQALHRLKNVCPKNLFLELFSTILTDNGGEFKDEEALDTLFGGTVKRPRLFYCDPRRSDQKGSCEKNHSELRQVLPKKKTPFDELDVWDVAVAASHINSNPRKKLCGKSPIQLFKLIYQSDGDELLNALGIEEIPLEKLTLKPYILDIERKKRGLPPISWQ